jgi:hypothetical protein
MMKFYNRKIKNSNVTLDPNFSFIEVVDGSFLSSEKY